MMTTLFEQETEVGKCSCPLEDNDTFKYAEPDYSLIYAQTIASMNGHKGLLRVEHHCYLRHGGEVPDQPWIKPEVILEPVTQSKEELIEWARQAHEKFAEQVRKRFPEEYLV